MKKYFILAATLFQFPHLFGQNYKINWENDQTISLTNGTSVQVPFFSNQGNYMVGNYYLPEFVVELNTENSRVTLNNVQYNDVAVGMNNLSIASIPTTVQYSSYHVTDQKGQRKLVVKVFPFIKIQNKIQRIESFSLVVQPETAKRNLAKRTNNSTESVLKQGEWFKIKVDKDGVFKLDRNFFSKNGLPTNLDPRKLKIYGNGEGRLMENLANTNRVGALTETPMEYVGDDHGKFDN